MPIVNFVQLFKIWQLCEIVVYFFTLYHLLNELQPHKQVDVGICNWQIYIYQVTVHVCVCAQGKTSAAGGAVGVPSSSREPKPQLHPSVDQSHGGCNEPLQPSGWTQTGWASRSAHTHTHTHFEMWLAEDEYVC